MRYQRLTLVALLGLLAGSLWAQPAAELKRVQDEWPGEPLVVLQQNYVLDIEVDKKGELQIRYTEEEEFIYTNDAAQQYARRSVSYSGQMPLTEVEAYTLVPDGNKYKKKEVSEFTTRDEFSSGVFHDDQKVSSFLYPGLVKGAKTSLSYSLNMDLPYFIPSIFLQSSQPIDNLKFTVICDEGVELGFSFVNCSEEDIPMTETTEKKRKKYVWKLQDIQRAISESGGPSPRYYLPHILPRVRSYTVDGEQKKVLNDLSDLHSWYSSLIKDVNATTSEELKSIADSLTEGVDDEQEKVRRIYYWVQDNVKYIAFEEGMEGFIPKDASQVCESRFGDCKGMSSIIHAMLGQAGVESHITWIGSRDLPYAYSEVPTPSVDNHMIVSYQHQGKNYFLDATGNSVPLDLTTGFIQGKEALVHLGHDRYEVRQVPIPDHTVTVYKDTTEITWGGGNSVSGKTSTEFTGFLKVSMRSVLKSMNDEDRKKFLDNYYEKGNNKYSLENYKVDYLEERDSALHIDVEFTLDDYVKTNGDEIYVNMNLERIYQHGEVEKDREIPLELRYKSSGILTTVLNIPEGYEVEYLPGGFEKMHERFGFAMRYEKQPGKVMHHFEHFDNYILLEKEDFEAWNAAVKALRKAYNEVVILKKISE